MIIRLPSLRRGVNPFEETISSDSISLEDQPFKESVLVKGEIDCSGNLLDIRLSLFCKGDFTCDRCAIDFEDIVETELRLQVIQQSKASREDDADIIYISERATEVDISQEIRDALLLGLPIKNLCQPDCKGLCFRCGCDLNETSCTCGVNENK